MSLPVGPAELRSQVEHYGPVAYLVTVSPDAGRPHVVSVSVGWDGDALVCGAGSRTAANIGSGADVTLLWSPMAGDGYSLIVDGPAVVVDGAGGPTVSVRPVGAVLHRLAGATGDGPGCIAVATAVTTTTTGEEEVTGPDEHPNATTVRRFLNAWFDGDFDTWTGLAADDIVIHMRGKPALDGSYRGRAGVMRFFEKFAAIDVESLEMEVEDVVADDRYAMIIMRTGYRRGDERLELRNACAYRIDDDGRIAEAWNVSDSQTAEHDFFHVADAEIDAGGLGVGLGRAVIEHGGVAKARGFLDALARGDELAMGDFFTDDVAWHVAGSHPLSGDHRGKQELLAYFGELLALTGGTFALAAESVLATDYHAAVFTRATAVREGGRSLDVVLAHAFAVRSDGLWREYWVCPSDQDAEDAFWS